MSPQGCSTVVLSAMGSHSEAAVCAGAGGPAAAGNPELAGGISLP